MPCIQIFTVHKRCSFSPAGIFFDLFQGQAATSSYVFDVFLDQPRLAKVKAYLVACKLADDVSDRLCAIDITLEWHFQTRAIFADFNGLFAVKNLLAPLRSDADEDGFIHFLLPPLVIQGRASMQKCHHNRKFGPRHISIGRPFYLE